MQNANSSKQAALAPRPHFHGEKYPKPASVEAIAKATVVQLGHLRVAAYLRYSDDQQKVTSIDDQLRTCRETAARFSMVVSDELVFADAAITGHTKATHKRTQYQLLRQAIRDGRLDVIICDQQCRLARSAKESLTFFDELEANHVRLLTTDGFDSEQPTARLLFGIKSVFSEFFLDETRHRVRRGMIGEFERGCMVTAIPYGYKVDPVASARTNNCQWSIDPEKAEVVREIFHRRKDGLSFNQIAAILNGRRLPTPRQTNDGPVLHWPGTAIWRILQSPIYKGLYQVNFARDKLDEPAPGPRLMPELALVSVQEWDACQAMGKRSPAASEAQLSGGKKRGPRGSYGGGKNPFAGIFRCGVCGATLSGHFGKMDAGSMHCIQCEHATAVGIAGRQALYVSIKGLRVMMSWLLEKVIKGEAVTRYREYLRERLEGGRESELIAAHNALGQAERARDRLARLLGEIGADDPTLEQEYKKAREETLHLRRQVAELEDATRQVNRDAIRKQLDIDLSLVVDAFLADNNTPERTRALLRRIFPSIVLKGKTDCYTAYFEVHVIPGAILAEASETAEITKSGEVFWVRLQTSGSKFAVWTVEAIDDPSVVSAQLIESSPQLSVDRMALV